MKEKGNPLLQIIRNVNDAVVVVLFPCDDNYSYYSGFFSFCNTESS